MKQSRTKNLALNVSVGYIVQFGIILLQFIGRRIFVNFLSVEYLGINGLYSNILSVLSLAELGLNTVVQYFFYKPVSEGNEALVRSLLKFFKKVYNIIAILVVVLGVALIPFLKYIVDSALPQNELVLYYAIFLANTVVSYYSAQKVALLAAYQNTRIQKTVTLATNLGLQILHIIVLVLWKNYVVYVLATLFSTLVSVIIINIICNKKYPYITQKGDKVEIDKTAIMSNVKSTFLYKVGAVLINNTDNILISVIVSTVAVGLYSNYFTVISAIQTFLTIITTALISGIGNLSAENNKEKMNSIFNMMLFFYQFVSAFCSISLYFLLNDFVSIWLGEEYLMSDIVVFAIAFNFYLTNAVSPIWMFREANGLFTKVKYLLLITAFANIVLSVIFGYLWGVFGILFATSIARIITMVWYEPRVLFRNVFGTSSKGYWLKQLKYFILTLICIAVSMVVSWFMPHTFGFIIIKGILYFLICLLVFFVGNLKTKELNSILNILKNILSKLKRHKQTH